jgi:hypothetical protein
LSEKHILVVDGSAITLIAEPPRYPSPEERFLHPMR